MSIVIIAPDRDAGDWIAALHAIDQTLKVEVWPEIKNPDLVEVALCWDQPAGTLEQFQNLKFISSLGAGANHLLNDNARPIGVPLVRLVDDDLKQSMAEYLMVGVLEHFRRFQDYRKQQAMARWAPLSLRHASEWGVGIMGYGELGSYVAKKLSDFGFNVYGWSRSPKQDPPVLSYSGDDELSQFLSKADVLVCLLPLTPETAAILNAQIFDQLPKNAYIINVARGAHLVEADLLAALDSGQLAGALLDVFSEEPLPDQHPFWLHEKIAITPHVASVTNPQSAARHIVENYRRALTGEPLLNVVDARRGY